MRVDVSPDGERDKVQRFEKHILVYLDDLYRTALRLTGQQTDAEDLVQETCVQAFAALDQLRHLTAAKVWVFSILRSVFLRQVERGPARGALVSLEDSAASLATPGEALLDASESFLPRRKTVLPDMRQAILKLPVPYREAVVLNHIGGFSYGEMAEILAVPTRTAISRLFRGRRMLRAYLGARQKSVWGDATTCDEFPRAIDRI